MKSNKDDIFNSAEDDDFFAPPVPPPRRKIPSLSESEKIDDAIKEKIDKLKSEGKKLVSLNCNRCGKDLIIPISIESIIKSDASELLVTYIHRKNKKERLHSIIFEIDKDFNVQLPKSADIIFSTEITNKKFKKEKRKEVYITCEKCGMTINIPVPEYMIKESKIPKTPIVFIHNNKYGMNQHALIAYLDCNFGDRATRLVDLLIIDLFSND